MINLIFFKEKATELLRQTHLHELRDYYTCIEMKNHAREQLSWDGEDDLNRVSKDMDKLNTKFVNELRFNALDTIGFIPCQDAYDAFADFNCTTFVHACVEGLSGDERTEKFAHVRRVWLQFVIDYEE